MGNRLWRRLWLAVLVILAVYLGWGHYLGQVARELAAEAVVVQELPAAEEISWHRPLVVHWFKGARVWLKYDDEQLLVPGGVQLEFGLERAEGQWRLVSWQYQYPVRSII